MRQRPGLPITSRGFSRLVSIIMLVVLGGLSACASDSGSPTTSPPETTEQVGDDTTATTLSLNDQTDSEGNQELGTPGVTDDSIIFGQSAAFTGPAQELGINMRYGIEAAFAEINQAGGIFGRQLRLVSFDDAYEPEAAIVNSQRLINQQEVFALIGAVGTPTSRSATPVAKEAGVPYVAPFTGAAFLRDATELDNVVNLRASYNQETEEMVNRLIEDLGITDIAVLFQDDSFGRAGYNGVLAALDRRGMEPATVGSYTRNTTAVKTAMLDIGVEDPSAVIIIGAYQPAAAMIAWSRFTNFNPVFINISFVGSNALKEELGAYGVGVYVTQVVPFPTDDTVPVVADYLAALQAHVPQADPGFVSLEGYLAGRLTVTALQNCGPDVTRECLTQRLREGGNLDLGGFELHYGDNDNQGSDSVFWTVLRADGRYHPIERLGE